LDSTVFTTLDLCSGTCQLILMSNQKLHSVLGPGLIFFSFVGLFSGAPSSFQRLTICSDLPFVATHLNDLLVHSKMTDEHAKHFALSYVYCRFNINFYGSKCHIGLSSETYLGHVFFSGGRSQTQRKFQPFAFGLHLQMIVHLEVSLD